MGTTASASNGDQIHASVPRGFVVALCFLIACAPASLIASAVASKHDDASLWHSLFLLSAVLGIAALVLVVLGWARHWPGRKRRQRQAQTEQLAAIGPHEWLTRDNIVPELELVERGDHGEYVSKALVDIVFANQALGVVPLCEIPDITPLISVKDVEKQIATAMQAAQASRESDLEQRCDLRTLISRNPNSTVIPVQDIIGLTLEEPGILKIEHAFTAHRFDLGTASIDVFARWLEEARKKARLPLTDPKPFSRFALVNWARNPGSELPERVMEELTALKGRPTLLRSAATRMNTKVCAAIRSLARPPDIAARLRDYSLDHLIDSAMKVAASGAATLSLSVTIAITVGLAEGKDIGSVFSLAMIALGFVGSVIGWFITLFGLFCIHDAESERKKKLRRGLGFRQ